MSIESKFELASRTKLRFETTQGALSVEDLWDLPLTTTSSKKISLDDIARELDRKISSGENKSFVHQAQSVDKTLQLKFDIVIHVINVLVATAKALEESNARAARRQRLLEVLSQKQDQALSALSIEEIQAQIDQL